MKIYVPPSHEEAQTRKRKAKHIVQFRGPLKIVAKPSETTFKLASHFNPKKIFHRHISNIRRWNGPIPDKNKSTIHIDQGIPQLATDVEVGDFILAREDEDTTTVDLGKITKTDDNSFEVTCYGRSSANMLTCKYLPVWTYKNKAKQDCVMLKKTKPRFKGTSPWTWTILAKDFATLAVVRGIELNSQGFLNSNSKQLVRGMSKRFHLKRF